MHMIRYITDTPTLTLIEQYLDNQVPHRVQQRIDLGPSTIICQQKRSVLNFISNTYLYYHINNRMYVDINHIISSLISSPCYFRCTYRKFADKIRHTIWTLDADNILVKRDLIDIKTMVEIILSQNCLFSTRFKLESRFYANIFLIWLLRLMIIAQIHCLLIRF